MSRAKWILAGATLALVALTLWAVKDTGQRTGYTAHAQQLFPELPAQAAAARRIEIRSAGQQVTLLGSGSDWKVVEKHGFAADAAKVRALLEGLAGLTLIEPRTADPARHAALHLQTPDTDGARGVLVRVLGQNDAVLAQVLLGKPRASAGQGPRQLFVRRPSEDQTWLTEGSVDPQRTPPLWLPSEAFDLPHSRIRQVSVLHPGQAPIVVSRPAPDGNFSLLTEHPKDRSPQPSTIRAVAYGLQRLPLQNVFKPDEVTGDWTQAVSVAFDSFDGLTVTARVLSLNGTPHVRLSAAVSTNATAEQRPAATTEAERINRQVDDWIYVIPPHTAATFTPQLDDLLVPQTPPPGDEPSGSGMPPGMMPGMRPPGL